MFCCFDSFLRANERSVRNYFLADNIKAPTGSGAVKYPSPLLPISVPSFGTGIACSGCLVVPNTGGGVQGSVTPEKIVFNMKNDVSLLTLKSLLLTGTSTTGVGNAYFVFSVSGSSKPVNNYYIKLSNYTVLEIDESAGPDAPTVQVSLGYSAIAWTIRPQNGLGGYDTPVNYGFDFRQHTPTTASAIPTGY